MRHNAAVRHILFCALGHMMVVLQNAALRHVLFCALGHMMVVPQTVAVLYPCDGILVTCWCFVTVFRDLHHCFVLLVTW